MPLRGTHWEGLTIGGIDARRVKADGRQEFFWWISELGSPALLLRMTGEMVERHPLPRIAGLDLGYRNIPGGRSLVVRLREIEHIDLFETLCRDIVAAGEDARNGQDALNRLVRRTLRWHYLLRSGQVGVLPVEEQRGLIGEIRFLRRLVDLVGARAAIESWKGPEGAAKDFELPKCCIEIKARRGAARPNVQITSDVQLADVAGSAVVLQVCNVDAAVGPAGNTLTDYAREVDEIMRDTDMASHELWESSLWATGFDYDDDYSEHRWSIGEVRQFIVEDGFPRVVGPFPEGVSKVKYSLSTSACADFQLSDEDFEKLLVEGVGSD